MQYLGGKVRLAKFICDELDKHPCERFVDLFCGGCAITVEYARRHPNKPIYACDLHEDLILMWQAVKCGWRPPSTITLEQYQRLRNAKPSALRGFVGFACSYAGKWFGGYARGNVRNYAATARRSILTVAPHLQNVAFIHSDYRDVVILKNSLVYCDPPYANTTGYGVGPFDTPAFWEWTTTIKRSKVVISEYNAPNFCKKIASKNHKVSLRNRDNQIATREECLFCPA